MSGTAARIEPGEAVAIELVEGEELVVTAPDGGQGGDLSFAGFDQALTRNANGWERYGEPWLVLWVEEGMRLFDVDAEPVLAVGPSRGPGHLDVTYPGCWSEIYEDRRLGCQDLISAALGIERRELTGMLSFFMDGEVEGGVYRGFSRPAVVEAGDYVTFSALRPVEVAVSACPDDAVSGWRPAALEIEVRDDG
ncbi:MAG TPA: DUF1989 domain-containing protein [Solirubrobacterales bacterium]